MKKFIIISLLLLSIIASIISGTLAKYTITIADLASGSVTGKEFIFLGDGIDTFQDNLKISPTQTVVWQFAIKNYLDNTVTETDLYYKLSINVHASTGKSAIDPLVITVKDENGRTVKTLSGTGTMDITGSFPLSTSGQSDSFTVEISWPGNSSTDINYAGSNFGTTVGVSVVGSQLPL